MSWMRYLLEANLYLCIFYLLYRLLLSRETHYALNRYYLLFVSVISFIIPMLQLGFLKPALIGQTSFVSNLQTGIVIPAPAVVLQAQTPEVSLAEGVTWFYIAGAFVFLLLLMVKLARLPALSRTSKKLSLNGYKLIELPGSAAAFSFFNTLYIGTDTPEKETIIRHELVHINQKHSADIMLMELLRVLCWFNPVVYLMQNELKAVHEYIADEKTAGIETDALAYSTFLVNNAYGIGGPSVAHSFFNKNLLKQRIIMLNQKRSGNLARLKYLLTLPVCAGLLCISTLAFSKSYGWVDLAPHRKPATSFSPHLQKSITDTNKKKHKNSTYTYSNTNVTGKGYAYKETGYLINGKTNFRVIITEKNGDQKSFFRDSATPAQIKMLQEKYGYTFPAMNIFAKLPPPPPSPQRPAPVNLPPPNVVPVDSSGPTVPNRPPRLPTVPAKPRKLKKLPPPVVKPADTLSSAKINAPQKVLINYYNDTAKAVGHAGDVRVTYDARLISGQVITPLIMVNGVRYQIAARLKPGERLYITGSDSSAYYSPGDARAKKKWGAAAANGVYDLHGKPSIAIR